MYNPKAKHSCSVVGCTDPHVSLHRLPTKEHHQLDSTPRPPDPPTVTTRAGLAIGRTGQCPRGRCTFLGRSPPPPPPSVVGRNGQREEISRTSRRNSLFTAGPPRQQSRSTPPPPPSAVGPVVARAEFGSQSSPGHNTHPSKAHTHRRLTLTPARTYKVAPQFVVRQPFLPQT